ncbi:S41 family peptidase [Sporosarcina sp. UB5]|uniref:lmo1851 family serine protease n=1 Tax=Sporosarcina sp. UB5 TaxID=3047463 RepID=UPI003D7AF88E
MDEKEKNGGREETTYEPPAKRYIRMKPFSLVMLIFGLVLATAAVTFFALTTGEDKVVEVVNPQNPTIERKEFKKLFEAYDEMKKTYYNEIDESAVVDGAINGMIEALGDPFSDYLNEEEARQLTESISSSFEGIGAEIQELNGYINIVSPIKNSPAERAGLLPNDLIIAVDGKSIQGMSSSEAVLLIRGKKGTAVTLSVRRGEMGEPFDVKIIRDVIPIETVYAEMLDNNIAHIRITSFSEHTYDELLAALDEMEALGMEGLIMDVRQNPGGMLNTAIDISDLFVEKGKNLFQYQGKGNNPEVYVASDGRKVNVPVTMIIDDGSASASEILAGALKESANVQLVGIKTYGKGTVQTPKELPDGSNLKLTTAKWLTPDGNWIHESGIEPTIEVPYPTYATLPFLDPSLEMKEGMVSTAIKTAEEMLNAVGFEPGEIDGLFDEDTEAAVIELQKALSLKEDGILVGDTTYGLMNKLRNKIREDDPQLLKAKEIVMEQIEK